MFAAGGAEAFASLVLARIVESASKLDSLRVLEENDNHLDPHSCPEMTQGPRFHIAAVADLPG